MSLFLQGRQVINELFSNIMAKAGASDIEMNSHLTLNMEMFPCYKTLTQAFRDTCVDTNQVSHKHRHQSKSQNSQTHEKKQNALKNRQSFPNARNVAEKFE